VAQGEGPEFKPQYRKTKQNKKKQNAGITFNQESERLVSINYKTLLNNIKEDLNKRKDMPCSWIGRLSIKTAV
jgi:hypothetical protein